MVQRYEFFLYAIQFIKKIAKFVAKLKRIERCVTILIR